MTTKMRIGLVACMLLFIVLEEAKPVLAGKGRLKARVKKLEEKVKEMAKCSGKCSTPKLFLVVKIYRYRLLSMGS